MPVFQIETQYSSLLTALMLINNCLLAASAAASMMRSPMGEPTKRPVPAVARRICSQLTAGYVERGVWCMYGVFNASLT